jgi:hypothetical protein
MTHFPWNLTSDTPEITGLPAGVLYMAKEESFKMALDQFKDNEQVVREVVESCEKSLDMRSVGGMAMVCLRIFTMN